MYINLLYLPLFNFDNYSFFPFLSTYLLALFSLLYIPLGTLLWFCFPVCALISFILVDIIFGFLCSLGQSIVLYFCFCFEFAYGCICICVYSVTFSIVINLCLYIALLQFCGVFLFSFFFLFFPLFSIL